jgi:hypothetical protein
MAGSFEHFLNKFYFKKWILGVFRYDISEIIRSKSFDPEVKWLWKRKFDKFYADPFILNSDGKGIKIFLEEFSFAEDYGKLTLMTLDKNFRQTGYKTILDTKSHLSYPFIFRENNKTYVFPEAGQSGKLSCYEYDNENETLRFLKDIMDVPLLDSTIIKRDGKYWIFGSIGKARVGYKLYIYSSDNLLGPYTAHPKNPVKFDPDGSRPAGNFIEVDGALYRPTQNCRNIYGESITVNKVNVLTESDFDEEFYMTISINESNKQNFGMHTIHTINAFDDLIVVDGMRWAFAPVRQVKSYLDNRKKEKLMKEAHTKDE